jgi:flagella basal body P-ring formation protein FlgA
MHRLALVLCLLAAPAAAESLVATRVIRAQAIVAPEDLTVVDAAIPGALSDPARAVGLEARVMIYPGRPIREDDLGPPAVVDRNALVTLVYSGGALVITAEGRALERGGAGDPVRVMNLGSRATLSGTVLPDGRVAVGPSLR